MKRLWGMAAAVLVVAGAGSFWDAAGSAAEGPAASSTSPVELNRCRIKLIDQVTLASDRNGILAFIEPGEGDAVQAGQHIAGLREEVAAAALAIAAKQAENDIEIRYSIKAAEVAKVEHQRAVDANRRVRGAVPEIEVRRLELAAERSVLQIEQAEHQLEVHRLTRDEAQAQWDTFRVEAPFDGVVTRVFKARGEAVRQGDPILEVVSTRRVRVEGFVNIDDIWDVRQGDAVKVQLEVPESRRDLRKVSFDGRIVFIDVTVQPVTKQVRVWAEVLNRDNILRGGLTAKMTIFPGRPAIVKAASAERPAD